MLCVSNPNTSQAVGLLPLLTRFARCGEGGIRLQVIYLTANSRSPRSQARLSLCSNSLMLCVSDPNTSQAVGLLPLLTRFARCGEGGIRTHGTLADTLVFKTSAFSRSATSPNLKYYTILIVKIKI